MAKAELPPIPDDAIVEEKFLAATGPGGQNVNKVATAVQLRIDAFRLGLPPYAWVQFKALAGSRLTADGELLITARRFRSQDANRTDARERAAELVAKARERQAKRVKTKPSKAAKARRMESKSVRSEVKKGRGKVSFD